MTSAEMRAVTGFPDILTPHRVRWNAGVVLIGGVLALLGAVVMAGWHFRSMTLVQVHPNFVPMQFNTALCFSLLGLGLLALAAERRRWTTACGLLAAPVGMLTLIQYASGADFGIDQLLIEHFVTVKTSHPGRMSPNTALCFSLAGTTLAVAGRAAWRRHHPLSVGVLGALVTGLGITAANGYLMGIDTAYGWGNLTRMAIHTSSGFIVGGAGLIFFAVRERSADETGRTLWHSIMLGIGAATLVVVLWEALSVREYSQVRSIIEKETVVMTAEIGERIETKIRPLARMAKRWEARGGVPQAEWESDARNYLDNDPVYRAIGRFGSAFRERWIVPAGDSAAALGSPEKHRAALDAVKSDGAITVGPPVDLAEGGKGFAVYVPLFAGGTSDGVIVGVFGIGPLLDTVMNQGSRRAYSAAVYLGERPIYAKHHAGGRDQRRWTATTVIPVRNVAWRLEIRPSPGLLSKLQSNLPATVLGSGLGFTLLLMLTVQFAQKTHRQARALTRSNKDLEAEIAERRRVETERAALTDSLQATNEELEAFCYSVSHDLRGPLRSMDAFSQALAEDCADQLDETGLDYLGRIRKGSQKMARLIDDLLALSRVSRGELTLRRIDLTAVAKRVADELRQSAPDRQVEVNLAPEVHGDGDARLIEVVFDNLLGNAWKFTGRKPQGTIEFGVSRDNGTGAFFVRDNGAGFDMAYADKLFEPFQRLHRTDEFEGTGIGLATVQRIIHRHGGRIWAKGAVNEGATVYFTLSPTGETP